MRWTKPARVLSRPSSSSSNSNTPRYPTQIPSTRPVISDVHHTGRSDRPKKSSGNLTSSSTQECFRWWLKKKRTERNLKARTRLDTNAPTTMNLLLLYKSCTNDKLLLIFQPPARQCYTVVKRKGTLSCASLALVG